MLHFLLHLLLHFLLHFKNEAEEFKKIYDKIGRKYWILGTSYGDSLGTGIDKERKRRKYKERVPVKGDQR